MTYKLLPPDNKKLKPHRVSIGGQTDPYSKELYNINYADLDEKLKILAILNDNVCIPTSHIFKSGLTFTVLKEHSELLSKKVILPECYEKSFDIYLEDQKNRFTDFIKKFSPHTHEKYIEKILEQRKEFLENNTSLGINWNFEVSTSLFKESLLYDLNNGSLRGQFNELELKNLVKKISDIEILTRDSAIELSAYLSPTTKRIYLSSIHATYHLSGACATLSAPYVPLEEANFLRQKFKKSVQNSNMNSNDHLLFRKYLEMMGISCQTLNNLNDDNILSLRKDPITHKFRTKYQNLISETSHKFDTMSDFSQINREFNEALNAEIINENRALHIN
ncbi:MAG: hypothetical protein K8R08_06785 [Methanosarcinales archaeon]|nr:hypothetical protein [Methanosarcinales archaeon]